jgi:hypothetical protein
MVFLTSQVMAHLISQIKQQKIWATIVFGPKNLSF